MALVTKRGTDVPEGAVVLTQSEALEYQKKLIKGWPRENEVFFLKYGSAVSFSTTLVGAFTVMDHFRRALNISTKLYMVFTTPPLLLPAYMSYLTTERIVTNNTLLMTLKCPLCNQLKFTALQAYCGLLFPTLYGLASYTMVAHYKNTYKFNISKFSIDAREFWKEMFKLAKGAKRVHLIGGLMQTALVFGLPYMQSVELDRLMHNLLQGMDDSTSGF